MLHSHHELLLLYLFSGDAIESSFLRCVESSHDFQGKAVFQSEVAKLATEALQNLIATGFVTLTDSAQVSSVPRAICIEFNASKKQTQQVLHAALFEYSVCLLCFDTVARREHSEQTVHGTVGKMVSYGITLAEAIETLDSLKNVKTVGETVLESILHRESGITTVEVSLQSLTLMSPAFVSILFFFVFRRL